MPRKLVDPTHITGTATVTISKYKIIRTKSTGRYLHAQTNDFNKLVTHMKVITGLHEATLKIMPVVSPPPPQAGDAPLQIELSAETVDLVLQVKRDLVREAKVREDADKSKSVIKSGEVYMRKSQDIVKEAENLVAKAGTEVVKRHHLSFKDATHALELIHLGAKDGQDWRTGMPAVKAGKTRTWQIYSAHASQTLLMFEPLKDLDTIIGNATQAII